MRFQPQRPRCRQMPMPQPRSPGICLEPLRSSIFDYALLHRTIRMILQPAAVPATCRRSVNAGVDLGTLDVILDLSAHLFDPLVDIRLAASLRLVAAPTDGEEEYPLGAGVEMLMEPHFRRDEHASRPPIDALFGFAFLPHERVAVSSDDQDMNAGPVTMRFRSEE